MKALVLYGAKDLRMEDIPMPTKEDLKDKVLVKIKAVGICGTEISSYKGVFPMGIFPRVVGHEIAGEVVSLPENGDNPNGLKVGDKVCLEPFRACGTCYPCSLGKTNCCESVVCIGVHDNGAYCEYFAHQPKLVHKVPDDMDLRLAAMVEPTAIALHGVNRSRVVAGEHVVVSGAGPIGILVAEIVKARGAIPIVIDMMDKRLDIARELGCKYTLNPSKVNVLEEIKKITNNRLAEVVIECAGAPAAVRAAIDYVAQAGRIGLVGYSNQDVPLPTSMFTRKELDIMGSRNSAREFPPSLELITSGKVNVEKIITNTIAFEEIPEYLEKIIENPNDYMKVVATL